MHRLARERKWDGDTGAEMAAEMTGWGGGKDEFQGDGSFQGGKGGGCESVVASEVAGEVAREVLKEVQGERARCSCRETGDCNTDGPCPT